MKNKLLAGLSVAVLLMPVPALAQMLGAYPAQPAFGQQQAANPYAQQQTGTFNPYAQQQAGMPNNGLLYANPTQTFGGNQQYPSTFPQPQYTQQQLQQMQQIQQMAALQQQQGGQYTPQQLQQLQQMQGMGGMNQMQMQPQVRYNSKRGANYFAGVELPKRLFNNIPPRKFQ